jgi:hypothetical protein
MAEPAVVVPPDFEKQVLEALADYHQPDARARAQKEDALAEGVPSDSFAHMPDDRFRHRGALVRFVSHLVGL